MTRPITLFALILLCAVTESCKDPVIEAPTPPGIVSVRATNTPWGVILGSAIQPNGLATTCQFDYGTTAQYGSSTTRRSIGAGTTAIAVVETLVNLQSGVTYHWRMAAFSAGGRTTSGDSVLTTMAIDSLAPRARTDSAASISFSEVQLFGTVNPRSLPTTCYFEYGAAGGSTFTSNVIEAGSGGADKVISCSLFLLSPGTEYSYRIVAMNFQGHTFGESRTFTTSTKRVPLARTDSASSITNHTAQLFGTVNPRSLPTSCYFEYSHGGGINTTIPVDAGKGSADAVISSSISSLVENTTYTYRIVAANEVGYAFGEYKTFTTFSSSPPTVIQYQPFLFSNTKVEISGEVGSNDPAATWHVEYGTTTSYGQSTSTQGIGSLPYVSAIVQNLTPGTLYHWRIVALAAGEIGYGFDSTFTLPVAVKPFGFPLKAGTTWRYQFSMAPGGYQGTHTWRVVSSDGNGNWSCMETRVDTLGDQTTVRNDSVAFIIRDLPYYYQVEFPEWMGQTERSRRIPKQIDSGTDSLIFMQTIPGGVYGFESASFVSGIGVRQYGAKAPSMQSSATSLVLRDYWVP